MSDPLVTDALSQLAPLAAAAAFLPTWTSQVILLLATDRGLPNALAFVFGNMACRLVIGFGALWLFGSETLARTLGSARTLPAWANAAIAATLLALGLSLIRNRPRAARDEATPTPKWLRAIEAMPPWLAFAWGFANVALPGAQWIFFLSALGVVAASGASAAGQAVLLFGFASALQVMLVTPIIVYVAFQERAENLLAHTHDWLARNGNVVVGAILLVFGTITLLRVLGILPGG